MRRILLILVTSVALTLVNAQEKTATFLSKKNEVKVYGGFVGSDFFTEPLDGAGSSNNKNSFTFGIRYLRNITDAFCLETGVDFFETKVEITPAFTGNPVSSREESLKLITIPLYGNYTFGKYFFVNGGFLLDFDKSKGSMDSQSGIGCGVGLGGKYTLGGFIFYVNTNLKIHSAFIPFEKERYHEKLIESSLQFGIGYRF